MPGDIVDVASRIEGLNVRPLSGFATRLRPLPSLNRRGEAMKLALPQSQSSRQFRHLGPPTRPIPRWLHLRRFRTRGKKSPGKAMSRPPRNPSVRRPRRKRKHPRSPSKTNEPSPLPPAPGPRVKSLPARDSRFPRHNLCRLPQLHRSPVHAASPPTEGSPRTKRRPICCRYRPTRATH